MKYVSRKSAMARTLIPTTAIVLSLGLNTSAHAFSIKLPSLGDIATVVTAPIVLPTRTAINAGTSIIRNAGSLVTPKTPTLNSGNGGGYVGMTGGDSEPFNGKSFIKLQPSSTLGSVVCVKAPCNPVSDQTRKLPPVIDASKNLRPWRLETSASRTASRKQPSTIAVNTRVQNDRAQRLQDLRKNRNAQSNSNKDKHKLYRKYRELRRECRRDRDSKKCEHVLKAYAKRLDMQGR